MALRVLHVGKFFPPYLGGMEVFLADLVRAQHRQGIEAQALVHGDPLPDDPAWLERVPVQFNLVFAPIAAGFRAALARTIDTFRPDVLHLHMPNNSALWALTLPAARKMPWVVHWHSDVVVSEIKWSVALAYMVYRPFEQALLERSDRVIATSPPYLEASNALRRWRSKCEVVPLGIDLAHAPEPDLQGRGGWRQDTRFRLLSIGRLTYYKGFETLIRAVSGMPGVELLIAGEGELRDTLETLIGHSTPDGHEPSVRLLGAVNEAEKHALLRECDVFCLASRERTEAFGIVLLEAMMHSRACIVTDLPGSGMPWVVNQAKTGLRVPFEDIAAWRSTIARLQHDQALRSRLGGAGPEALQRRFGIGRCADLIAAQYRQCAQTVREVGSSNGLLVVIATENHSDCIGALVGRVHELTQAPVLVVDNRSTDATCHRAKENGATIVQPLLAMTTWGCLQTGIRLAQARGFSSVITIDANSRYEVEEIGVLLSARATGDVVTVYLPEHTSLLRSAAWKWFRVLTRLPLKDFVSGFRLYNAAALSTAATAEATLLDYQDIGTLLLFQRRGLKVAEVELANNSQQVNRSRIFRSWVNAIRYFAASSLLSVAHWRAR